ncbi:MAG: M56 family metallopeptidase [Polyangiaceae bacterium]
MIGRIAFDLALNVAVAFGLCAAVVLLLARGGRARWGGLWAPLLALPFLKAVVELVRGIPERSFFWAFLAGARQELGSFRVGLGVALGRLHVDAVLSARSEGTQYPTSLGELLARGLTSKGFGEVVEGLGLVVLMVSSLLVLRRLLAGARFAWDAEPRELWAMRRAGRREVPIVLTDRLTTPFTSGWLRPYVGLPRWVVETLSAAELEAVIAHELAHVARRDLWWTTAIELGGDLLWFCPGRRALLTRFRQAIEEGADARAVAGGVDPARLASAILRVAEQQLTPPPLTASLGLGAAPRIRALLRPPEAPSRWRLGLRLLGWAICANTLLFAVLLGNHG